MNCELNENDNQSDDVPKFQPRSLRKSLLSLLSVCILFGFLFLNGLYPFLRFTIQTLNTLCFVVGVFLPALVAIGVLRLSSVSNRTWIRITARSLSALLVIVTVLLGLYMVFFGVFFDVGEQQIRTRLLTHGYAFTAYMDDDGVLIFQERILMPGIALVRRLDFVTDADQPKIEFIGKDRARVTLLIHDHQTSKTHEDVRLYDLKPFVYF